MRERQLATRSDKIVASGKTIFTLPLTTTPASQVFSPSAFGDRIARLSSVFARWRIVKLIVVAPAVATTAITGFGIADDVATTSEGPILTSLQMIAELRCSKVSMSTVNPNELVWNPIDIMKWYYVLAPSSGLGDARLVFPATLWAASSSAATANFAVYYTLEFEGAYDVTA